MQANGLLLRPNGNSQFSSNSENVSTNVSTNMSTNVSTNVSTPFSQISGISSYDYEDDFTSDDEHSDFSAMTNVSRRTDKSSKIPIKRSSSLRRRPDLMTLGTSGPPTPSPKGSSSPKLTPASPTLPPSSPPAPVPEPKPEDGEDLLLLTDPEVCFSSEDCDEQKSQESGQEAAQVGGGRHSTTAEPDMDRFRITSQPSIFIMMIMIMFTGEQVPILVLHIGHKVFLLLQPRPKEHQGELLPGVNIIKIMNMMIIVMILAYDDCEFTNMTHSDS